MDDARSQEMVSSECKKPCSQVKWIGAAACAILLGTACGAQQAQPQIGIVQGQVIDREGAVYQGARVALTLGGTGVEAQVTASDESGRFRFEGVPAGLFTVTVSSQGFGARTVTGTLAAGASYEAPPIVLAMSGATTEVRVTASQHQIAQQELLEEEHQRVLGFFPNFNVVYDPKAPPLSAGQKFHLSVKQLVDWTTFAGTAMTASTEQAGNSLKGYGQGTAGYTRRFGAAYGDNVIGTMIGSALFPSLLKQDPRYFYKGDGTRRERIWYAIKMSVVCKGDNGHWQPNYSDYIGDVGAASISNLYYPAGSRNNATVILSNILIGKATDIGQNIFQEFFARRLTPKVPSYTNNP